MLHHFCSNSSKIACPDIKTADADAKVAPLHIEAIVYEVEVARTGRESLLIPCCREVAVGPADIYIGNYNSRWSNAVRVSIGDLSNRLPATF